MRRIVLVGAAAVALTATGALAALLSGLGGTTPRSGNPAGQSVPGSGTNPPVLFGTEPAPAPFQPRAARPPAPIVTSPLPPPDLTPAGKPPRIVGGPGISPGPVVSGTPEREEPPAPTPALARPGPGPAPDAAPPAPPGPAWLPFTQVVVIGPGRIDLGGLKIVLADIVVPERGIPCRQEEGEDAYECAFLSHQALRQRIRARGIECLMQPGDHHDDEPTACRIGNTDLGLWLVQQGWAAATPSAPDAYRAADRAARCQQAGIWFATPKPKACPPA